ncbi:MAG: MFS transporter [Gammaproteobacteria bacterium]|nr:MFS transporter [Gammaproteobacteria bacterium]
MLVLLLLVYLFNFVDRQIFSVVLESIKREFNFTDTQLGLLGGIAFGFFYATVGLPLARIADRCNRRNLIAISLAIWSGMTALCGQSSNFVSLFLARMGVGIGEAGGMPPSYSLLADYFPPRRRGFALAIFNLGIPFGVMTGFLVGGWINQIHGWRAAFMAVGLPGVALAILLAMTLREPRRGRYDETPATGELPSILSTALFLWARPSCRHLCLAASLYGLAAWGGGRLATFVLHPGTRDDQRRCRDLAGTGVRLVRCAGRHAGRRARRPAGAPDRRQALVSMDLGRRRADLDTVRVPGVPLADTDSGVAVPQRADDLRPHVSRPDHGDAAWHGRRAPPRGCFRDLRLCAESGFDGRRSGDRWLVQRPPAGEPWCRRIALLDSDPGGRCDLVGGSALPVGGAHAAGGPRIRGHRESRLIPSRRGSLPTWSPASSWVKAHAAPGIDRSD